MFNFWQSQILDLPNAAHKPYLSWPLSRCVYVYVKCLQYRRLLVRIRRFLLLSLFVLIQESKLLVIRFQGFVTIPGIVYKLLYAHMFFRGENSCKHKKHCKSHSYSVSFHLPQCSRTRTDLVPKGCLTGSDFSLKVPSSVGELTVQHEPSRTHSFYADIPRHSAIPWHTMSTHSLNWSNLLLILLYTWGNFQERSMHLKLND